MSAFLLTRLAALALVGAFEEIRRRAGVKRGRCSPAASGWAGKSSRQSAGTIGSDLRRRLARPAAVEILRARQPVRREASGFALGVLAAHADFKEVEAVGSLRRRRPRKAPCRR